MVNSPQLLCQNYQLIGTVEMRRKGTALLVGDWAITDYNSYNPVTVRITDRKEERNCESGIMLQVAPALRGGTLATWYDANWFKL